MDLDQFAGALIDAAPDGVILVDDGGRILLANPIAASMFARTVSDLVGSSVDELVPSEFRSTHHGHRAGYVAHPSMRPMGTGPRLFAQNADGGMFPVEVSLSPVDLDGRRYTIATIRDVSDRQEFVTEMAMLKERERIARDIHDMVIQRLFAAGMSLQAVQGSAQPPVVAERIAATINELDDTIRELRAAIFRLGQQGERRSLSAQLTEIVHERSRHLGFEPELRIVGDVDHLPDFIADQLVATVTEGLSNVVRHAQATSASIHIEHVGTRLSLSILDNGRGLPPTPKRAGGLSNMMWRAAELGGSCTVRRNEPNGTVLVWDVPV
ncbi:MAG TPA: PAS domain S-box protein [Ilumatobacteraceae bacterium]|nr:PAS domain S-box protein [Ilumatobacteraceae bacterium]